MSIDPSPITEAQRTHTDAVVKWNETLRKEATRIIKANMEATQLELRSAVGADLHNLFDSSYPGAFGLRVNPKGDKQIEVILTLDKLGNIPSIKIKQRYNVPLLMEVDVQVEPSVEKVITDQAA